MLMVGEGENLAKMLQVPDGSKDTEHCRRGEERAGDVYCGVRSH